MNILFVDTETTGLKPEKSFILTNGSILYNSESKKYDEFYEVLNWDMLLSNFNIPEDTIKVHGITKDIMHDEGINPITSMSNYYKWIYKFCKDSTSGKLDVVVAFNLSYDLNMFISNLKFLSEKFCSGNFETITSERNNLNYLLYLFSKEYIYGNLSPNDPNANKPLFIDSLFIDRIFNFEVDGEKVYHDLQTVGERYNIPVDPDAHNAIADTRRTFKVFLIQMDELQNKYNVQIDQKLESRLIRGYKRNQDYWKKGKDALDYLANNMNAVTGGIIKNGVE